MFKIKLYNKTITRIIEDSPLAGSIMLSGTILKLASYGMLRVLIKNLPDVITNLIPIVQCLAIIAIIYASVSTIVQQDTKRLIAYSSIAHISVVVLGIFSNTIIRIEGAILLAIALEFVSPALFICVGGVIFNRIGPRIIDCIRGLASYMPIFTILFLIVTLSNTGIPISLKILVEQLSLMGV
jgi:NADH-ubiquinone oxidoreductase chain 4